MPTITFRVTDRLAEAIDEARGGVGRSDWLRGLVEARLGLLESGAAVAQTPVKRTVAGSNPASPAKPSANADRFRERIVPVITGSWRTPRQISQETGLPERVVEGLLRGMDVEWARGAVRMR